MCKSRSPWRVSRDEGCRKAHVVCKADKGGLLPAPLRALLPVARLRYHDNFGFQIGNPSLRQRAGSITRPKNPSEPPGIPGSCQKLSAFRPSRLPDKSYVIHIGRAVGPLKCAGNAAAASAFGEKRISYRLMRQICRERPRAQVQSIPASSAACRVGTISASAPSQGRLKRHKATVASPISGWPVSDGIPLYGCSQLGEALRVRHGSRDFDLTFT